MGEVTDGVPLTTGRRPQEELLLLVVVEACRQRERERERGAGVKSPLPLTALFVGGGLLTGRERKTKGKWLTSY